MSAERYTLGSDNRTIKEDGLAVAIVPEGANSDTGARLVGKLNLADRDEALLDQLGNTITGRNVD